MTAIAMLFAAHRDRDPLRIDAAMRHLESLDWRKRMANNLCSGERVRFSQGTARSHDPLHITEAEALESLAPEWPDVAEIAR